MLIRHSTEPITRHRQLQVLLAVLAVCFLVAGVYRALSPSPVANVDAIPEATDASAPGSENRAEPVTTLAPLQRTEEPRAFAIAVAEALFDWDTDSPVPLNDYTGRLLTVADPTGVESPGLVTDLATYLPTASAWVELRRYRTRQWLEVTSATVPDTWAQAVAEGEAYDLAEGTTAYTITGIRHRAGVWEGRPVETAHRVSFTVYLVCAPTYPTCHLLRISKLDHPLR